MIRFAVKRGYSEIETKVISLYAIENTGIKIDYFIKASDVPTTHIPLGTIDWVTDVLGYVPVPDHYPDFLSHLLYRKIWIANEWPLESGIFIKPYDKPKRFGHRITTGTYKGKKKGPYWCSEVVEFIDEWRYYVVNGKITYAAWYQGQNEDAPPPKFDESIIPDDWCGVIDMGLLSTGEFALVEAGEPYSMGWYGNMLEGGIYTEFLSKGWKWLNENSRQF